MGLERLEQHPITQKKIDRNALDVVNRLTEHGFDAFLVGGCVRDLMCGVRPKDFDVATNATPEEVRHIFRRARLVGRRFPIAHVRYGREVIEVSTFRQSQHDEIEHDDHGMIIKDRAFGTIADDAFRRDFTINALYYDPATEEVLDYVGGAADIAAKKVRFIGEAPERLAEDPVRMLRALRFSAKLGFDIDADILDNLDATAERLSAVPRARLFDEFLKLFLTGYGHGVWQRLKDTPLRAELFPATDPDCALISSAMKNTDTRIASDLPVTPGFLIAVLLWDDFSARLAELSPQQKNSAVQDVAFKTLSDQQSAFSIPRRFSTFAREVWALQDRLITRNPRTINRILHHKRFRAAFDFLTLRADSEPELKDAAVWWEEFQEAGPEEQHHLVTSLPKAPRRRKPRRRRRNRSDAATQS